MTISGCRSLISLIARSSRFGTKYGPPQWRSEIWAIVKGLPSRPSGMPESVEASGAVGILA